MTAPSIYEVFINIDIEYVLWMVVVLCCSFVFVENELFLVKVC